MRRANAGLRAYRILWPIAFFRVRLLCTLREDAHSRAAKARLRVSPRPTAYRLRAVFQQLITFASRRRRMRRRADNRVNLYRRLGGGAKFSQWCRARESTIGRLANVRRIVALYRHLARSQATANTFLSLPTAIGILSSARNVLIDGRAPPLNAERIARSLGVSLGVRRNKTGLENRR
jgi:hypothetical protein